MSFSLIFITPVHSSILLEVYRGLYSITQNRNLDILEHIWFLNLFDSKTHPNPLPLTTTIFKVPMIFFICDLLYKN